MQSDNKLIYNAANIEHFHFYKQYHICTILYFFNTTFVNGKA